MNSFLREYNVQPIYFAVKVDRNGFSGSKVRPTVQILKGRRQLGVSQNFIFVTTS